MNDSRTARKQARDAAYDAMRNATGRDAFSKAHREFLELMESQREIRRLERNDRRIAALTA